jgi:hypothetical protein
MVLRVVAAYAYWWGGASGSLGLAVRVGNTLSLSNNYIEFVRRLGDIGSCSLLYATNIKVKPSNYINDALLSVYSFYLY